jgi:hypothetical protein
MAADLSLFDYYSSNKVIVLVFNQDKSAASFCHQVAAWASDMICKLLFIEKSQNY